MLPPLPRPRCTRLSSPLFLPLLPLYLFAHPPSLLPSLYSLLHVHLPFPHSLLNRLLCPATLVPPFPSHFFPLSLYPLYPVFPRSLIPCLNLSIVTYAPSYLHPSFPSFLYPMHLPSASPYFAPSHYSLLPAFLPLPIPPFLPLTSLFLPSPICSFLSILIPAFFSLPEFYQKRQSYQLQYP